MRNLTETGIKRAYRRYAEVYDVLFGQVFQPGRRAVIKRINAKPRRRVLEVGVGTGLALPLYSRGTEVVGIDFSSEMLAKARRRVARHDLKRIELHEMDAQSMAFPDNHFDAVAAMYVVSVVPDFERLLAEIRRVCTPGGDIIVVNHFHSDNPILRALEKTLKPVSDQIGFRPDLDLQRFCRVAAIEKVYQTPINAFGFWQMIHFRNTLLSDWPVMEVPGGTRSVLDHETEPARAPRQSVG
ncbi:MAG: class I SAM-dependent methyltransferase [Alphaproteobacteria bacterium]